MGGRVEVARRLGREGGRGVADRLDGGPSEAGRALGGEAGGVIHERVGREGRGGDWGAGRVRRAGQGGGRTACRDDQQSKQRESQDLEGVRG